MALSTANKFRQEATDERRPTPILHGAEFKIGPYDANVGITGVTGTTTAAAGGEFCCNHRRAMSANLGVRATKHSRILRDFKNFAYERVTKNNKKQKIQNNH